MLLSVAAQSVAALLVLRTKIAPEAGMALTLAVVGYVVTRSYNLYFAERARVRHEIVVYSIQQITGPALDSCLVCYYPHFWRRRGRADRWLRCCPVRRRRRGIAAHSLRLGAMARGPRDTAAGPALWCSTGPGRRLEFGYIDASRFIISDMLGVAAAGLFASVTVLAFAPRPLPR